MDNRLAKEIVPKAVKELQENDMMKHPSFAIQMPRGRSL